MVLYRRKRVSSSNSDQELTMGYSVDTLEESMGRWIDGFSSYNKVSHGIFFKVMF